MVDELNELEDKIHKLEAFSSTATFDGLPDKEQFMLVDQRVAMEGYRDILKERLEYYVTQRTPV